MQQRTFKDLAMGKNADYFQYLKASKPLIAAVNGLAVIIIRDSVVKYKLFVSSEVAVRLRSLVTLSTRVSRQNLVSPKFVSASFRALVAPSD